MEKIIGNLLKGGLDTPNTISFAIALPSPPDPRALHTAPLAPRSPSLSSLPSFRGRTMNSTSPSITSTTPTERNSGVIQQIASVLDSSGVDAPSALYDEALSFAREGLLGASRDRLRMLLCLDPDDGEAHLLLAKVFIAQQRWADSLSQLDAATAARVHVPDSLRQEVEEGLRSEREASEARAQRVATREQAELHSLRDETRRLRTENTRLFRDVNDMKRRVRSWSAASAIFAGVSATLVLLMWLSPNDAAPTETYLQDPPLTEALDEIPTSPAEVVQPTLEPQLAASDVVSGQPTAVTPVANGPRVHVVKSGDTLYDLAGRYYSDSNEWTRIHDANKEKLGRDDRLKLGMELLIP